MSRESILFNPAVDCFFRNLKNAHQTTILVIKGSMQEKNGILKKISHEKRVDLFEKYFNDRFGIISKAFSKLEARIDKWIEQTQMFYEVFKTKDFLNK